MELVLLRSRSQIAALSEPALELMAEVIAAPNATYLPEYFLPRLYARCEPRVVACYESSKLVGVVYMYEVRFWRICTGYAFGGDGMGRGLLLCAPTREAEILSACCGYLLDHGLHALRFDWTPTGPEGTMNLQFRRGARVKILADPRTDGDWLPLQQDYDSFLAGLGSHTRRNLRYYRRKAESSGFTYVRLDSDEELRAAMDTLNELSDYPTDLERAARDQRYVAAFGNQVAVGLRSGNGVWVSIIVGFIAGTHLHILTQLNDEHDELRKLSLSIVLRGYLIEDFIQRGFTAVHFLEGSSSMLGRFCADVNLHHFAIDDRRLVMTPVKRACAAIAEALHKRGRRVPFRLQWAAGSYWSSTPGPWW